MPDHTAQPESFASLEAEWRQLVEQSPADTLFLTPLWQRPWADGIVDGEGYRPLAVRDDDRLVGVAPVRRTGERVVFGADPEVCDYLDLVAAPGYEKAVSRAVLDYFEDQPWRTIELIGVPEISPTLEALSQEAKERGYTSEHRTWDVSPRTSLPATWEEYLQGLGKKDRHELRRKLRRLERSAEVQYRVITDTQAVLDNLDDFFRLMRLSRDEEKAEFLTPERERFFRYMAQSTSEQGYLRLFLMDVDGKPVSGVIGFVYGDTFLLYNSGFDPDYSNLSVGLLLKAWCVGYSIQQGLACFDFLRGDEPYKYDLGGQDHVVYQWTIRRGGEG